jgi:N,N-dimethylformamidase
MGAALRGECMKRILGYCQPWSVTGGDRLEVKVSALADPTYRADVVRVVCGVDLPGAPPVDVRAVAAPINGEHPGHPQTNPVGSAVRVDMQLLPAAAVPGGFRVKIWPTLPGDERQAVIGWWDEAAGQGLLLTIEDDGHLAFSIGEQAVRSNKPLRARQWVEIEALWANGDATLTVRPVDGVGGTAVRAAVSRPLINNGLPLMIGAIADPAGGRWSSAHYNGKIEAPMLLDSSGDAIAAWDFASDHHSRHVEDRGPHGLHGETVNLPARAVTGSRWTGDVDDWRFAPEQYAAIHFHDDDLYDAGWETSLAFDIPDDWSSGYYAVHLTAGDDESWLPFFVTPAPGMARARLAVIASTATTIAYGNGSYQMRQRDEESVLGRLPVLNRDDMFLRATPWLGLSQYDTHRDGSGVRFSSRLRPIVNIGPYSDAWNLNADTLLYAWLDRIGEPYDIITDEDIQAHGADLLTGYACVIAGSHPEYHTTQMLDAHQAYLASGGRLMYLGGNGFYWRLGASAHFPGAYELRRAEGGARIWADTPGEYHMAFTGELGGLWRRCGRPPQALVGVGMRAIGFDGVGWYEMQAGAHDPRAAFLVRGLDHVTRFGESGPLGSAAGEELDAVDAALGTPDHVLIIASSTGHSANMQLVPEDMAMPHPALSGAYNPDVRADVVFFETPAGGAVFATGSMTWTASLSESDYANPVAVMTHNALSRFLDPALFVMPTPGTDG